MSVIYQIFVKDNVCICPKCSNMIRVVNNDISKLYCNSCYTSFNIVYNKNDRHFNDYLLNYENIKNTK